MNLLPIPYSNFWENLAHSIRLKNTSNTSSLRLVSFYWQEVVFFEFWSHLNEHHQVDLKKNYALFKKCFGSKSTEVFSIKLLLDLTALSSPEDWEFWEKDLNTEELKSTYRQLSLLLHEDTRSKDLDSKIAEKVLAWTQYHFERGHLKVLQHTKRSIFSPWSFDVEVKDSSSLMQHLLCEEFKKEDLLFQIEMVQNHEMFSMNFEQVDLKKLFKVWKTKMECLEPTVQVKEPDQQTAQLGFF